MTAIVEKNMTAFRISSIAGSFSNAGPQKRVIGCRPVSWSVPYPWVDIRSAEQIRLPAPDENTHKEMRGRLGVTIKKESPAMSTGGNPPYPGPCLARA